MWTECSQTVVRALKLQLFVVFVSLYTLVLTPFYSVHYKFITAVMSVTSSHSMHMPLNPEEATAQQLAVSPIDALVQMVKSLEEAGLVRASAPHEARKLMSDPRRLIAFVQTQVDMAQEVKRRSRNSSAPQIANKAEADADADVTATTQPAMHALVSPPTPAPMLMLQDVQSWVDNGCHNTVDPLGLLGFLALQPLASAIDMLQHVLTAVVTAKGDHVMAILRMFVQGLRIAEQLVKEGASPFASSSLHRVYTTVRSTREQMWSHVLPGLLQVPWVRTFFVEHYFASA